MRRDVRIDRIEVTGSGDEAAVRAALGEVPGALRAMLAGGPAPQVSALAHGIARDVAAAVLRAEPGER